MPLILNDIHLHAIVKEADKLKLDDTAAISIGVWTHVPQNEITMFNMPEFKAVIKFDLSEIRNAINV